MDERDIRGSNQVSVMVASHNVSGVFRPFLCHKFYYSDDRHNKFRNTHDTVKTLKRIVKWEEW